MVPGLAPPALGLTGGTGGTEVGLVTWEEADTVSVDDTYRYLSRPGHSTVFPGALLCSAPRASLLSSPQKSPVPPPPSTEATCRMKPEPAGHGCPSPTPPQPYQEKALKTARMWVLEVQNQKLGLKLAFFFHFSFPRVMGVGLGREVEG